MPWRIQSRDGQFCVVGPDGDPIPGGCHDLQTEAEAHRKALYANTNVGHTAALSDPFPLDPPDEWFSEMPDWFVPGMKLTVVTDGPEAGRVAATVADRRTFILGNGDKWKSPPSPSGYREAHQGDTYTASGKVIDTATLAADVNHVNGRASFRAARDAMANTGTALARVRFMDVDGHTVALGAAWPGLSDMQVRKMQASALSGDWRWREEFGEYDLAGTIFVNTPGLPLPSRPVFQPVALAASLGDPHPAVVGGWVCNEEGVCSMPNEEPVLTLTLSASETARLHALLTQPEAHAASAGACSCGSHTAGLDDELMEPEGGTVSREEFDAVVQRLEELEGELMARSLSEVDAISAALPLPPDLEDERQHAMPPFVKDDPAHQPEDGTEFAEDEEAKRKKLVNA